MGHRSVAKVSRLRHLLLAILVVGSAMFEPLGARAAANQETQSIQQSPPSAACPANPSKSSSPGAVCGDALAPSSAGVASVATLPRGSVKCPSVPGKLASSDAASCTPGAAPDMEAPIVSLPAGRVPCPAAGGKESSPVAACWNEPVSAPTAPTQGKISLPAGATRCPDFGAKKSSPEAACDTRPSVLPPSVTHLSLPPGAQACPSTVAKPSLPTSTCTLATLGTSPRSTSVQRISIPLDIPGYSVSLSQSTDGLATGQSMSLTAYANLDVGPTPYWIEIYDSTTGGLIASCGAGTSCSTSVSQSGPTTHNFIAYIGSYSGTNPPGTVAATSNTVTCTWFSLSLSANPYYLGAGQTSTVTASVQPDVGPTPYWLGVYDSSTGGSVAVCASGTSCGGSVNMGSGTSHSFVAYVAGYGTTNPPPNVHVTSNTVYVTWYTVSLSASPDRLAPGGTTTLTASASSDVLPSPFYISIFDYTTNARLTSCASGTSCAVNVQQIGSTVRDYIAYIGNNSTTLPPSPVANSNIVRVTWISVSLNICNQGATICTPSGFVLAPGATAVLTATATMDIGPTSYLIQFYDQTTGLFVAQCGGGSVCTTGVTQTQATQHSYIAYVNCCGTNYPPPAPRATSNAAKATWLAVQLFACSGQGVVGCTASNTTGAPTGGYITLNAVANAQVDYSPYLIELFDQSGQFLASCASGSSCAWSLTQSSAGTHSFIAFVSRNGSTYQPPDIQAQSAPLALPWVVNCTSGVNTTNTPCNPTTFADNLLVYPSISGPVTGPNEYALQKWNLAEGGGGGCDSQKPGPWPLHQDGGYGAAANPFNTTQGEPGSYNYRTSPPYVQSYTDYQSASCWYWGVKATADTLTNGYYPPILAVLRSPAGDNHTQCVNLAYAITHPRNYWGTADFSGSC